MPKEHSQDAILIPCDICEYHVETASSETNSTCQQKFQDYFHATGDNLTCRVCQETIVKDLTVAHSHANQHFLTWIDKETIAHKMHANFIGFSRKSLKLTRRVRDGYFCYLCELKIATNFYEFSLVDDHIQSEEHRSKKSSVNFQDSSSDLDILRFYQSNFTCYQALWKELESKYTAVEVLYDERMGVQENEVICYNCIPKQSLGSKEQKLNVFLSHEHRWLCTIEKLRSKTEFKLESNVVNYLTLVNNSIFHKEGASLFCEVCSCEISGIANVPEHVYGSTHTTKIKEKFNGSSDGAPAAEPVINKASQRQIAAQDLTVKVSDEQVLQIASDRKLLYQTLFKNKIACLYARLKGFCYACDYDFPNSTEELFPIQLLEHAFSVNHVKKIGKNPLFIPDSTMGNKGKKQVQYLVNNCVIKTSHGQAECKVCQLEFKNIHQAMPHCNTEEHKVNRNKFFGVTSSRKNNVGKNPKITNRAISQDEKRNVSNAASTAQKKPSTTALVPRADGPTKSAKPAKEPPKNSSVKTKATTASETRGQRKSNSSESDSSSGMEENSSDFAFHLPRVCHEMIEAYDMVVYPSFIYCPSCECALASSDEVKEHVRVHMPDKIDKIDESSDEESSEEVEETEGQELKIARKFRKVLETVDIVAQSHAIYCNACKVTMTTQKEVDKHLSTHLEGFDKRREAALRSMRQRLLNADGTIDYFKIRKPPVELQLSGGGSLLARLEERVQKDGKDEMDKHHLRIRYLDYMRQESADNYLQSENTQMYLVSRDVMALIRTSCRLLIKTSDGKWHCLICREEVEANGAPEEYELYTHIRSKIHCSNLWDMEQDNEKFKDYPDQFSDLRLAEKGITEIDDDNVQCFACNLIIKNDDEILMQHIKFQPSHLSREAELKNIFYGIYDKICAIIAPCWNDVWHMYYCTICNKKFKYDFDFQRHLSHQEHQKKLMQVEKKNVTVAYDSCVLCGVLWMGSLDVYGKHCLYKEHKFAMQNAEYLMNRLPASVETLLDTLRSTVRELTDKSNMLRSPSTCQIHQKLIDDLERDVKSDFPHARAYMFGSRVTCLGSLESDIDIFLDCRK